MCDVDSVKCVYAKMYNTFTGRHLKAFMFQKKYDNKPKSLIEKSKGFFYRP